VPLPWLRSDRLSRRSGRPARTASPTTAIPPSRIYPGDILITNDPWLSAGHFFDITLLTPIFRNGKMVALFANTCHSADIAFAHHHPADIFEHRRAVLLVDRPLEGMERAGLDLRLGVGGHFGDVVGHIGEGREDQEAARFSDVTHELRDANIAVGRTRGVFDPAIEAIPTIGTLAVLGVGVW